MTKDIKDYLHLYPKCEVIIPNGIDAGHRSFILSIHENGNVHLGHAAGTQDHWNIKYIKPILRPLSDMTEEEAWEFVGGKSTLYEDVRITKLDKTGIEISYTIDADEEGQYPQVHRVAFAALMPKEFLYLLSKGFDLFGLIDAGLAIDKTKLKESV